MFITFVIIFKFKFILIYLLHVLIVFKIKVIFGKKSPTQKCAEMVVSFIYTSEKRALRTRISALFIAVTFENYERYFFYEILLLIKSKNINVCCFF